MRILSSSVRVLSLALVLGLPSGAGASHSGPAALPSPPVAPRSKPLASATTAPATGTPAPEKAGETPPEAAPTAGPKSNTIKLVVKTIPAKRAFVYWGKKRLGVTDRKAPLVIQRPRDSGPLDLVVRADDCVPVYTRAYTFDDSTLAVKVTALDQKQTIYGYKAELPPEDGAQGDAAAPGAAPLPGATAPAAGGRGGSLFTR